MLDMDTNVENEQIENGVVTQKRTVKLTEKALLEKLDKLQNIRKSKLNKASNIRKELNDLMYDGDKTKEVNALDELTTMCDDAKEVHNSLMALLSVEEGGKHEIWFKAKMLPNNECTCEAMAFTNSNIH